VKGDYGAHGRFDDRAKKASWEMFTSRHRNAMWGLIASVHQVAKRLRICRPRAIDAERATFVKRLDAT
jgi:hypothetical protein